MNFPRPNNAILIASRTPLPSASTGAPIFLTPDAVRTRLNLVNGRFQSLNLDVRTNVPASGGTPEQQNFLAAWNALAADWQKFYQASQGTLHLLTTGTGTVNRQVDAYEQQMASFQERLSQVSPAGRFNTPRITSTNPLGQSTLPATSSVPWWIVSLLTLAGVGVVGWVGYAGYRAYKEAQEKKRILEEEVAPRVVEVRTGFPRRASRALLRPTPSLSHARDDERDDEDPDVREILASPRLPARDEERDSRDSEAGWSVHRDRTRTRYRSRYEVISGDDDEKRYR